MNFRKSENSGLLIGVFIWLALTIGFFAPAVFGGKVLAPMDCVDCIFRPFATNPIEQTHNQSLSENNNSYIEGGPSLNRLKLRGGAQPQPQPGSRSLSQAEEEEVTGEMEGINGGLGGEDFIEGIGGVEQTEEGLKDEEYKRGIAALMARVIDDMHPERMGEKAEALGMGDISYKELGREGLYYEDGNSDKNVGCHYLWEVLGKRAQKEGETRDGAVVRVISGIAEKEGIGFEEVPSHLGWQIRKEAEERLMAYDKARNAEREYVELTRGVLSGRVELSGKRGGVSVQELIKAGEQFGMTKEAAMRLAQVNGFMASIRKMDGEGGVGAEQYRDVIVAMACLWLPTRAGGAEQYRDVVVAMVTDEEGRIDKKKFELFKLGYIAYAKEQQGNEGFGATYRYYSASMKLGLGWAQAWEGMKESREAAGDKETVLRAVGAGVIKAEEAEGVVEETIAEREALERRAEWVGGAGYRYIRQRKLSREDVLRLGKELAEKQGVPERKDVEMALRRLRRRREMDKSRRKVYGFMREATGIAEEVGDDIGWWKKSLYYAMETAQQTQ